MTALMTALIAPMRQARGLNPLVLNPLVSNLMPDGDLNGTLGLGLSLYPIDTLP